MSSPRRKWTLVAGVLAGGAAGALLYLKPLAERAEPPVEIPPLAVAEAAPPGEAKDVAVPSKAAQPSPTIQPWSQPSRPELSLNAPTEVATPKPQVDRPPVQVPATARVTRSLPKPAAPLTPAPTQLEKPAQSKAPVETPATAAASSPTASKESPFAVRPPQLPTEFPRDAVPQPAAAPLSAGPGTTPPAGGPTTVERRPMTPLRPAAPRERLHIVRDGDTLSRLAERYLGDSRRRLEIFEDNQHVLRSPDVLPIGAKLRIVTGPPRAVTVVVDAPQTPVGVPGAIPAGQGPRPLEPLPPGAFADRAPQ